MCCTIYNIEQKNLKRYERREHAVCALSARRVLLMRHGGVLGAVRSLCKRLFLIWLCFGYKQSIKDDALPVILCTALIW